MHDSVLTRRHLLQIGAMACGSALFAGCRSWTHPHPEVTCNVATAPTLDSFLVIDSHCHVFNGTDLQVKEFLARVEAPQAEISPVVGEVLGGMLQDFAWSLAPDGRDELELLKRLNSCQSRDVLNATIKYQRQKYYERAKAAIKKSNMFAKYKEGNTRPESPSADSERKAVLAEITRQSSKTYRERLSDEAGNIYVAPRTPDERMKAQVNGSLDYVFENFRYRFEMVQDYLNTYKWDGRTIDLMFASLVDYDYWLHKGHHTRTPLKLQVLIMEQISILTRGRVHGFVPFDPLREVAYRLKKGPKAFSSLELVRDAIVNRGFIGVKLYPPMGFAPYGNTEIALSSPHFWRRKWLPSWVGAENLPVSDSGRTLGYLMDDVLAEMYDWCCQLHVPVMAHTTASNAVAPAFAELAGPAHWAVALEKWPTLRISFGHMGDFDNMEKTTPESLEAYQFVELMMNYKNTFGDSACFSSVLAEPNEPLRHRIEYFYDGIGAQPVLPQRFLFGTDWDLLMTKGHAQPYLNRMFDIYDKLSQSHAAGAAEWKSRFFGLNAVDWVGLNRDGWARKRLEDFYRRNSIDFESTPPDWMAKLNNMGL